MRTLFLALLAGGLFIPLIGSSQVLPVDSVTHRITYTGVVQVEGATADQLFSRATLWYAGTFKSAKSAMDLNDRAAGVIVSSNDINFPAYYVKKNGGRVEDGRIRFRLKIECREGRFRYSVTDLEHVDGETCNCGELERETSANLCLFKNLWQSMKLEADKSIKELITNLTSSMANPKAVSGSDW